MTIARVKQAAAARGAYFDGVKKRQNNVVGFGYSMFSPSGCRILQSDTLQGLYNLLKQYKKG